MLDGERETPLPWSNVLANPAFGTIVSSSGSAFTWAGNSRENRLTPFANDPLTDPTGEAIYLRDDESGAVWGATPGPLPRRADDGRWVIRHAAGVTRYQHAVAGVQQELAVFVAPEDPVKLARADADQHHGGAGDASACSATSSGVSGRRAPASGASWSPRWTTRPACMLARNAYNTEFSERVAFWRATETPRFAHRRSRRVHRTQSHAERAGRALPRAARRAHRRRARPVRRPAARRSRSSPGESRRVAFVLGQGRDRSHAIELAARYASLAQAQATLAAVERMWDDTLGAVQVHTPDDSFDLIVNRWLLYQTLDAVASGRAAARISPAAPSASAISSRTCSR